MRRGQTLVLMMLTMLLLVLMVCMTLGISARAKEKAELQTMADAAAFTNATATARTYNVASLLNRTMVSHYAAMAAVQSELVWVTALQRVLGEGAGLARMMELPDPAAGKQFGCYTSGAAPGWYECPAYWRDVMPPSASTCRTTEVRDAAYEFWHAALSNWTPTGAETDDVSGHCKGGVCSQPRSRLKPYGMAELDQRGADQVKDIHEAIIDLARIQHATYGELKKVVSGGKLTKLIVQQARAKSGWGPFDLKGEDVAWKQELERATDASPDDVPHMEPYQDTMAQAVMGTRIYAYTIQSMKDALTPRLKKQWGDVASALNSTYPGHWKINITSKSQDVHAEFASSMGQTGDEDTAAMEPGMGVAYARFGVSISVSWKVQCAGSGWLTQAKDMEMNVGSEDKNGWHGILHDEDPSHFNDAPIAATCHGNHVHYGERWKDIHALDDELLPREAIGYVFPYGSGSKAGGRGAWGQPEIPVLLTKKDTGKPDPWELDFKFRLKKGGAMQRLDLNGGSNSGMPKLAAFSSAIAYYHRRGHVGEPPNMLNPYWHATLIPPEIDEHGGGKAGDNTPGPIDSSDVKDVLKSDPPARTAYVNLRKLFQKAEDK